MPKFENQMEIDAPVEKVWEVMVNPELWPQWFPGMDSVAKFAASAEGATFEWVDDGQTGSGVVTQLVPQQLLEVQTLMGKDKDSHTFHLKPSGGFFGLNADECTVEYTLDTLMGGGILGNFIAGGNPKDVMRVKKALHLLRKLVEATK